MPSRYRHRRGLALRGRNARGHHGPSPVLGRHSSGSFALARRGEKVHVDGRAPLDSVLPTPRRPSGSATHRAEHYVSSAPVGPIVYSAMSRRCRSCRSRAPRGRVSRPARNAIFESAFVARCTHDRKLHLHAPRIGLSRARSERDMSNGASRLDSSESRDGTGLAERVA